MKEAGCCCCLLALLPAAPLQRGNGSLGACRESCEQGNRQRRHRLGDNAAPAELRAHGVAALGKGDEIQGILPHHPKLLILTVSLVMKESISFMVKEGGSCCILPGWGQPWEAWHILPK